MKRVFFFIAICFYIKNYSQNFKGYYVTNQLDTINCVFEINEVLFDRNKFDPQTVRNNIRINKENNQSLKFKPNDILSFFIENANSKNYKFVSIPNHNYFYHEIIKGKLSYYKVYLNNSGGVLGSLASQSLYLFKDEKLTEINPLNLRKGLSKQIIDYPELHEKWNNSNKYYRLDQFEEVIKLYNDYFDKK